MAQVRGFFARPIEEKIEVKSDMPMTYEGYAPGTMIVNADRQHPCWTERLMFARKADAFRSLAHRVWREDDVHDEISQDSLQYFDHMDALTQQLIELLSEGLGVESQQLGEFHDNTSGAFNAAHYPPCPRPELARGLRPHTDPHTLSVLYQEYPGLQVLKDGKWLAVRPEIGTLLVNFGDMLQLWSNGRYLTAQRRVALNFKTSRLPLIFFNAECVISAPFEIVDEAYPRKYRDVSWKEYIMVIRSGKSRLGHVIENFTM